MVRSNSSVWSWISARKHDGADGAERRGGWSGGRWSAILWPVQEPSGIPTLSRRGTIAAVAVVLLPLVAIVFNTVVLSSAREDAGPPEWTDVPALPDGLTVVEEEQGCTPGNWVRCWRVRIVVADDVTGDSLADDLGAWFRDHDQDLYAWRSGWRHPDCSRETGICLAVDPAGTNRARIEISRMSDGL